MVNLPKIRELKELTQSIATLDLIISPEWDYRDYSYNKDWSDVEAMASMRNGTGDEWFILFHDTGWAGLKGFAHESGAASKADSANSIRLALPRSLGSFSDEPAFSWDQTTFCYWVDDEDATWQRIETPAELETGEEDLLAILSGDPREYVEHAEEYFELEVPFEIVNRIYEHEPMTSQMIRELNPDIQLVDIAEELAEIGYPCVP